MSQPFYRLRRQTEFPGEARTGFFSRFSGVAALLVLWEIAAHLGWISRWLAVPPSRLPAEIYRLAQSGELQLHLGATLHRVGVAFAIGGSAGALFGLAAGRFALLRTPAQPLLGALTATPKLALLPLAIAVLGMGESSRNFPAILACFTLMAMHCMDAVQRVQPAYVELARGYGASGFKLFRYAYLPPCLPQIFTGLRLSLAMSLVMVVAAEMIGATSGIGVMIWLAGQSLAMPRLYAGLIVCAALGFTLTSALYWLERRCLPWASAR
ncbi:MAG: ABC transporter permease [Acidobacteria bacterium]|nr:ABC transporter permease [Acidobacteriota bacterium]